jgi:hypothetical protein
MSLRRPSMSQSEPSSPRRLSLGSSAQKRRGDQCILQSNLNLSSSTPRQMPCKGAGPSAHPCGLQVPIADPGSPLLLLLCLQRSARWYPGNGCGHDEIRTGAADGAQRRGRGHQLGFGRVRPLRPRVRDKATKSVVYVSPHRQTNPTASNSTTGPQKETLTRIRAGTRNP